MNYSEKVNAPELEGQSAYITRFDDAAEAATHIRSTINAPYGVHDWETSDSSWTGLESGNDAIKFATTGNDALVGLANTYLSQIQHKGFETSRGEWLSSVAGAYPVVGDYLAGRPNSMRKRSQVQGEHAPVRLILDTTSSAGIDAAALQKRGAAALALAMAMMEERPVELWQLTSLDAKGKGANDKPNGAIVLTRCPTTPINLGVCAHLLTSQQWTRGCGYGYLIKKHRAGGRWPFAANFSTVDGREKSYRLMRAALDLSPQDILVDSVYLTDPLITAPVQWINNELAKLRGMAEDSHSVY